MNELQKRITNRFQLSTDKFNGYIDAVETAFGCDVDYAQLQKIYHGNGDGRREGYSPSHLLMVEISKIMGNPEPDKICTSYIERQNLTIRTQLRRFTRLTNAFSKKLENLKAALAIHFWHYNFMRYHRTLKMTPAMAAGVSKTFMKWDYVLA